MYLTHLECSVCQRTYNANELQTVCPEDKSPLLVRYDLDRAKQELDRDQFGSNRPNSLWRWFELLPIDQLTDRVDLGEGGTPHLHINRIGSQLGFEKIWIKDEGQNPTGSFKARGMAMAITRAKVLGVKEFVVPTAGNAGGAAAAYVARAGLKIHVFMPKDAPPANIKECREAGADVQLIDGLINDAGRIAAEQAQQYGWFDLATLKEPYRIEGKKTMGYEIAQDFGWDLPEVIVYPAGGGTGLIGIWKAFNEMWQMGWLDRSRRPRMVAVQSIGCQPIVKAFQAENEVSELHVNAQTIAAGLRVPKPLGDRLMLRAIRESGGTAIAVPDEEIIAMTDRVARVEGISMAYEGAATIVAAKHLLDRGWIKADERVLCLNTGAGWKNQPAGE